MRLAACSACLPHPDLPALLDYLQGHGIAALELGVGAYPGTRHADAHLLAKNASARLQLQAQCSSRDVQLMALACQGNPLHPRVEIASRHSADLYAALEAANALEVPVVVAFSGQPGTGGVMNWPVMGWPQEYADEYERQWQEQLIPYWQAVAHRAQTLGVRIALELHGGFAVHSPATLRRLREACGPAIGATVDPSHLWWQGINPAQAIALLGQAVLHVHLKDVCFRADRLVNAGLLDTTPHSRMAERAWYFGAPGEGHDAAQWQAILDALSALDYRGALCIEHEGEASAEQAVPASAQWMRTLLGLR